MGDQKNAYLLVSISLAILIILTRSDFNKTKAGGSVISMLRV